MPELRHDPIQKRWVIIATERARRPSDFRPDPENTVPSGFCPFCEGNEDKTPPEIFAVRPPDSRADGPGWTVRVVANKFPALRIEGELERTGVGMFDKMNGVGAHEVVIETPRHDQNLADLPEAHVERLVAVYQQRLNDLKRDPRLRYILIFKNYGVTAGASLSHPHTQLIATPVTPMTVAQELEAAREHYTQKERCLFCDVIRQETESGARVVYDDGQFVALAPFASRFPFEVFLAPREHAHDFGDLSDEQGRGFAGALRNVLRRLKVTLQDPPYNFVVHTAPNTSMGQRRPGYWATLAQDFHWHVEIIPRLTRVAGFEWGTGFYINPTPPEDAARFLRDAATGETPPLVASFSAPSEKNA